MMLKLLSFALVVLAVLTLGRFADAQEARRAGTVRLESATGGRGPIELRPFKEGYSGELAIANDGKEPLVISRIAIRGDAGDPRSPPKVVARLVEGSLPATIAPGTSRKAFVQWTPERGIKQRQLFGHVVVTSSDEQSGEVAMGVRAQLPGLIGPLENRALSILLLLPLLGAVAMFLARALGRKDDLTPRFVAAL